MPLIDQLFTNIIANPPVINPGAGGWDSILSAFMANRRGRHGFGLLARLVDVGSIPVTTDGTILVTCPPGWRAMPLCVQVFAASNPNGTMDFTIDTGASGEMWAGNVSLVGSAPFNQRPWLVFPSPEGNNFFNSSIVAQQIPIVDGDDGTKNTFRVNRDSAADIVYSFFVFGHAWQTTD